MKKLILLTAIITSTTFASHENFCKSIESDFNNNMEAAIFANSIEDIESRDLLFKEAKKLFYTTITSNCKENVGFTQMKIVLTDHFRIFTPEYKLLKKNADIALLNKRSKL